MTYSIASATLAGIGLLLSMVSGSSNPHLAPRASRQLKPPVQLRRVATGGGTAEPCPMATDYGSGANGGTYFLGVSDSHGDYGSSVASAQDAAILGGSGNSACAMWAGVGTGYANYASGQASFVSGGGANSASEMYSVIDGGYSNAASGIASSIDSGQLNSVSAQYSAIGSGYQNSNSGPGSFIGAGQQNMLSGGDSFDGAGADNTVAADYSFVGSGNGNTIASPSPYSVIVGGVQNKISGGKNTGYASIGGGLGNQADGKYASIPGGYRNEANGELSFAGGYTAEALNSGSFVWSDYATNSSPVSDTGANQFVVRSSGGVYIYSNEAVSEGVELLPGAGAWSMLSDRNAKTDVDQLDEDSILAQVAKLPITTWRYRSEMGVRHLGPMAQDFYAAFGVGEDDRHLTSIDEDGVALASIKALNRENSALRKRVFIVASRDRSDILALRSALASLRVRVEALSVDRH